MAKTSELKTVEIKLDQLVRLHKDLEESIRRDEISMRKNNSRPKDVDDQLDFAAVKKAYEHKLDQLIFIKDAIRVGNSTLDKDGYTNDHNIFLLSNLNRRRAFLSSLNTFEGKRTTLKSKGKEIEFKANLKWKDVDEELKKIEGEVREFENKLSDFNHSTTVSVNIYSDLGLL